VLEVGCGAGNLARALADDGFSILAIDPEAPDGTIFRRTTLEALDAADPYDAAIATYSLHHIGNLDAALDKIVGLLAPEGRLVVEEFGWDRVDKPTAEWYAQERDQPSVDSVVAEWRAEHEGLHPYEAMRSALGERFVESFFEWRPYLYRCLEREELEEPEREAIVHGRIQAVGFRYVGLRR
jgi:SAM-dependent methyltransferase